MEEITIRLNDFLFNSGILGFIKVLENAEKEDLIETKANTINANPKAIENFASDYISAMLNTYEEDTKWYTIVSMKEWIRNLDIEDKEQIKKLEEQYKFIKKSMESASYKAGYEILKKKQIEVEPYDFIEQLKKEKDIVKRKELIIKIIEHIEKNKRVYCMKDIIYTKINCFWSNVAFLNRNANKNDIEEEYQKVFVTPVLEYIKGSRKSDIKCIECGNPISKKEASGMSWLNDVGVDINRKKSGFWNFKEDTYICPICNLIYSCVPLGFNMIGSNGIFVNNNESVEQLKSSNDVLKEEKGIQEESFEKVYGKILYNFINRTDQTANEKIVKYEPRNIQVIKRIGTKDNQKYEFNMIAKDKLEILKNTNKYFEKLLGTNLYQEVLTNLLEGRKQYSLIARLLRENRNIEVIKYILLIQLNSMGGKNVQNRKERIEEIIEEGEKLQKYFFHQKENENKLKSYAFKLQGALKANNVEEFMKLFTLFYGSLGIPMPNCEAIKVLIEEPESFRLLGYSYIYGLEKILDKKREGGNENEE